jgi:predicted N-formylglutamate amidohydrolase
MTEQDTSQRTMPFRATVEAGNPASGIVVVCEHASHVIPPLWGDLGLDAATRVAHIAWDPGALALARGVAALLGAWLVHAPVSRLVYDLNRSPDHPGAMPARSEVYDIPGNAALSAAERAKRTENIYVPFHADLHGVIAGCLSQGMRPVIVTIHSFTPVFHGKMRAVEFGVIHDADPTLANWIVAAAEGSGLRMALNEPYCAADGVTHTLRLQATPYGLQNAMLEVRNDLIATPEAAAAMAGRLAPILTRAIAARQIEVA